MPRVSNHEARMATTQIQIFKQHRSLDSIATALEYWIVRFRGR
jgi:hypothetical protein